MAIIILPQSLGKYGHPHFGGYYQVSIIGVSLFLQSYDSAFFFISHLLCVVKIILRFFSLEHSSPTCITFFLFAFVVLMLLFYTLSRKHLVTCFFCE